ncbi:Uncharacterised protein [Mycobacteroides abscessus subsp. abscessus]|nr:Uncharacterised protein [Mycobacteroides abscessus subsp. abscessus]
MRPMGMAGVPAASIRKTRAKRWGVRRLPEATSERPTINNFKGNG